MNVEHCPICGGIISDIILLCYPPIYKKECQNCKRNWEKQEKEKHVTFNPDEWKKE